MNQFQKDLSNLKQNQYILYILIFTLVTIVVWVGLNLVRSQKTSQISPELKKLAEPLNPNLNPKILDELQLKRDYTDSELRDFPVYSLIVEKNGSTRVVTLEESRAAAVAEQNLKQSQSSR